MATSTGNHPQRQKPGMPSSWLVSRPTSRKHPILMNIKAFSDLLKIKWSKLTTFFLSFRNTSQGVTLLNDDMELAEAHNWFNAKHTSSPKLMMSTFTFSFFSFLAVLITCIKEWDKKQTRMKHGTSFGVVWCSITTLLPHSGTIFTPGSPSCNSLSIHSTDQFLTLWHMEIQNDSAKKMICLCSEIFDMCVCLLASVAHRTLVFSWIIPLPEDTNPSALRARILRRCKCETFSPRSGFETANPCTQFLDNHATLVTMAQHTTVGVE